MKIKVKNLVANPYRNIEAYPIDRAKVEQLRNSIRETTFWDNILARPAPGNGQYQIAYGHHRLIAIKEELGKDTIVDIPVRDLSDEDMLRIMANENMDEWATDWRIIVETVGQAKKFLEEHIEVAKKYGDYRRGVNEGIGRIVIERFLGANWSAGKINQALAILRDKEINTFDVKRIEKKIDISTLHQLSTIQKKESKRIWIEEQQKKDISAHEMQEIARFENEPTLSEHDKEIVRENILEGRIRGKEQIREQVEFIKVRKLQEGKKSDEEKRRENLKDFINKTDAAIVSSGNKLRVLAQQFREYPETMKYLPSDETLKLQNSLTDFLITIKELINVRERETSEKLAKELEDSRVQDISGKPEIFLRIEARRWITQCLGMVGKIGNYDLKKLTPEELRATLEAYMLMSHELKKFL